jgi:uncharacterized membrane-anchored protein
VLVSVVGFNRQHHRPFWRCAGRIDGHIQCSSAGIRIWYLRERVDPPHRRRTARAVLLARHPHTTFALGTAAGDFFAETLKMGWQCRTAVRRRHRPGSPRALRVQGRCGAGFWIAYILTRPFGASLGDLLSQPHSNGGMGLGTTGTSALFLVTIVGLVGCPAFRDAQRSTDRKMKTATQQALTKVPEVTLGFWIIKIAATTLGETGGDAVSMSMNLGYLVGGHLRRRLCRDRAARGPASSRALLDDDHRRPPSAPPWRTLPTDAGHRLCRWHGAAGHALTRLVRALVPHDGVGVRLIVNAPKAEAFYWLTIMFSQTLGTALGDWTADTAGLGYTGAAVVFGGLLALVVAAYYWTSVSRTLLFWAAFILTRPLGAVVGDFLDKPVSAGGLALSRYSASAALLTFIVVAILLFRQRAARTAH